MNRISTLVSAAALTAVLAGMFTMPTAADAAPASAPSCSMSYPDLRAVDDDVVALPGTSTTVDVVRNDIHPPLSQSATAQPVDLFLNRQGRHWMSGDLPNPFDSSAWPSQDYLSSDDAMLPHGVDATVNGTAVTVTVDPSYDGPSTILVDYWFTDFTGEQCTYGYGLTHRLVLATLAISTNGSFTANGAATKFADSPMVWATAKAKRTMTVKRGVVHRTAKVSYDRHGATRLLTGHGKADLLVTRSATGRGSAGKPGSGESTQTESCSAPSYEAARECATRRAADAAKKAAEKAAKADALQNAKAAARENAIIDARVRARHAARHATNIEVERADAIREATHRAQRDAKARVLSAM